VAFRHESESESESESERRREREKERERERERERECNECDPKGGEVFFPLSVHGSILEVARGSRN